MIINGGSRSNGAFFGRHLMRADRNERVEVIEIRGLAAQTVPQAFREMQAVASGTRAKNYFYHANLNTRADEVLTPEQWTRAVATLEHALGLVDQPRLIVEHEKDGRTHRHVVWSRIDADSMTAISDALTYPKHEIAAREIEQAFGLQPVESVLTKDRDIARPERNPRDWESFRGQESKRDPKAIKAEVTALWQSADSGVAFAAALKEHGYILTRGDRRDFCLIDPAGDEHSLARRIAGAKAADIRARMNDIDPASLPSVAEGRALVRDEAGTADVPAAPEPDPREPLAGERPPVIIAENEQQPSAPPGGPEPAVSPDDFFLSIHFETVESARPPAPDLSMFLFHPPLGLGDRSDFAAVHNETISQATADMAVVEVEEANGGRFDRLRAWWGNLRAHFVDWLDHLPERFASFLGRRDGPATTHEGTEPDR